MNIFAQPPMPSSCSPSNRSRQRGMMLPWLVSSLLALPILAPTASAQDVQVATRNYDARSADTIPVKAEPTAFQKAAAEVWQAEVPDLAVKFDPLTGAGRSVKRHTGFLTEPNPGFSATTLALDYAHQIRDVLGLSDRDLQEVEITDVVFSKVSGVTHVYARQLYRGIPVYNGQLHVNIDRDGRILSVNNAFVPHLEQLASSHQDPARDATDSVRSAAEHLGLIPTKALRMLSTSNDERRATRLAAPGLSLRDVDAELYWLPVAPGDVRLVWNFTLLTPDDNHVFNFNVDAETGQVWTRLDQVQDGSYRVFALPDESPVHGSQGRALVVDPEDATASPNGWLANPNGIMLGNNVHACVDRDGSGQDINGNPTPQPSGCDAGEPTCAAGVCDFPLNLAAQPSASIPASITNLFYWSNVIHDVQYQYGFDEAAGNFQTDNFGNGGLGGDAVRAEGQDGDTIGSNCNANFRTFVDGDPPRMQMFTCNSASPDRDGDYDNGVILHEYGHGISNRQVGGPSNVGCLGNAQQAGEGWSDLLALMYTAEPGDAGTDSRGVGAYLINATPEGGTIRDLPYSTDNAVNNWTYESIQGASIPHGVGSRWAQIGWELYWALVAQHGTEPDLLNFDINDANEAGNKRAMFYYNEGLKNTACSPTFVDNRDGIIAAATASFGGQDVCLLWQTFAAFGLGTDAVSGGSGSTNPTNGFAIPAACQCTPQASANAGADQTINEGQSVQIGTAGLAGHTYSWSPGGATTAQITVSPTVTTTYTVTATTSCGTAQDSVTVTVIPAGGGGAQDAVYNAGLGVPACLAVGSSCDSTTLVDGRANLGPESNQPNTLDGCTDGTSGTYHSDESNDRIVVTTLDGSNLTEGATVRIDATVWAWTTPSNDTLDLYFAADANNPSWTLITSLTPATAGAQTLSATYTLPAGALQAVRASFRYQGSEAACASGNWTEADDLVFAVETASGCTVNADCDDGTFCNGAEICNAGTCEAGTPVACGDGVSCTVDSCNEATDSCDNTPDNGLCSNGLFCDGAETCDVVNDCQAGTPVACGDGVSCTVDSCNEATDSCDNTPDDSLCDNGLFCDGTETCDAVNDCQAGNDPCPGQSCNESADICEGGGGPQVATFDAGLGVPACSVVGSSCDSSTLVDGRHTKGPEPNQPNTLDGCADGTSGTYHSDESNDRIVVSTLDGSDMVAGATVQVEATVWAWNTGTQDTLDLYFTADANNPTWTLIASVPASGGGAQTLSANYTLPTGSLQAVRASFRYQGSQAACSNGNWDDADDLVFPVN
ncbi:MAG: M36 family metallopeptidase [Acidobacteriota bacterium]